MQWKEQRDFCDIGQNHLASVILVYKMGLGNTHIIRLKGLNEILCKMSSRGPGTV